MLITTSTKIVPPVKATIWVEIPVRKVGAEWLWQPIGGAFLAQKIFEHFVEEIQQLRPKFSLWSSSPLNEFRSLSRSSLLQCGELLNRIRVISVNR